MSMRRTAAVLASVLGLSGLHLGVASKAEACSCAFSATPQKLRPNEAAALVTRTKGTAAGKVEVLHSSATSVPARISGPDDRYGCGPSFSLDSISAVLLTRTKGTWAVQTCGYLDTDATFQSLLGKPKATATGTPVAWLTGGFGGSRAAALNAQGQVVAWAEPGYAGQIAVCPGAKRVVTTGLAKLKPGANPNLDRAVEVLVHDAVTLRTLRRIEVPGKKPNYARDLRCADSGGRRIDVLLSVGADGVEKVTGALVSIDGTRQRRTALGEISASVPVADGFVVATGGYRASKLSYLRADGTTQELPAEKGVGIDRLAADPAGRHVVVDGYGDNDHRPMWIVDLRTGKAVARKDTGTSRYELVWAAPDRILTRAFPGNDSRPPFEVFDARLRSTGTLTAVVGVGYSQVAAIGTQLALFAGGARFAVQNQDGTRALTTSNIRLSNAEAFAAAPGRTFDLPHR